MKTEITLGDFMLVELDGPQKEKFGLKYGIYAKYQGQWVLHSGYKLAKDVVSKLNELLGG